MARKIIEMDESVLCRRGVIRVPSHADDEIPDTLWILGIYIRGNEKDVYVVKVPDRKAEK